MNVVIAGASQGVGMALCKNYLSKSDSINVFGTYRNSMNQQMQALVNDYPDQMKWFEVNVEEEASFKSLKEQLSAFKVTALHRFINCIGALQIDGLIAEKKVEEIELVNLKKSFLANSFPTIMFAKYLKDFFRHKDYAVFAAVSAKVGSISDNSLGGWYSYRASKTALNMFIKNLSLEFKRLGPDKFVVTIHPGTTDTRLSEPFMSIASKKYKIHTPAETADNLINVFENLKNEDQGAFLNYDHSHLSW